MPAVWASIVFIAAFLGFAAKAGVIPLHVWLPEAHPAAPSNVSALMSGVMLKTAIYGILRVGFDLASEPQWWWGGMVLVFGLFSAVLGILYALMQDDIKRLLAYSSVENIGITLIAVGLAMIFAYVKMNTLAALAMAAALYHMLNHAVFKGLLFMGAGAVLHATHERSMEGLGGLIHKMKWTAPLFLVGCLAASGLPPFNGFVSEWLIFQSFLLTPALPGRLLNLLIPLGAAALALAAALSARGFVKVFGITFLGQWRGKAGFEAVEVNWPMRAAMMMAAASCLALGVFPTHVIGWLDSVPQSLVGGGIGMTARASGWLWLTPVASETGLLLRSSRLLFHRVCHRRHLPGFQGPRRECKEGADVGLRLREGDAEDAVHRHFDVDADEEDIRFRLQHKRVGEGCRQTGEPLFP